MTTAVCISCGFFKKRPFDQCLECGFLPKGNDLDMAKSIYLSTVEKGDSCTVNTDLEFLKKAQSAIQQGFNFDYDSQILDSLVEEKEILDSEPSSAFRVVLFGMCFLILPIIALIVFLFKN